MLRRNSCRRQDEWPWSDGVFSLAFLEGRSILPQEFLSVFHACDLPVWSA